MWLVVEFTLLLTFVSLKLTGVIDWSWWGVTAPIWVSLLLAAVIGTIEGLIQLARGPAA